MNEPLKDNKLEENNMNESTNQSPATQPPTSQTPNGSVQQLLKNKSVLIGIAGVVVLILLIVGLLVWMPWQKTTTKTVTTTSRPVVAVVEITSAGFLPGTLNVHPNTEIVWVNEDVAPHLPAADPYPTHASLPSLVAPRALGQKETYCFKVSKAETIRYHDDLNPTMVGTIVVE